MDAPRPRPVDRIDAMMVLLVLIWGTAFPVIPYLQRLLDPFQLTWYRYAPFPIIFGMYVLARRRGTFAQVEGRHWPLMVVLGFLGVVGYHFSLNWAMHGGMAVGGGFGGDVGIMGATAAILVATTPLWTLGISVALGRERLVPAAAVGSLVAFAGVALIVLRGQGAAEVSLAAKAAVGMLAPLSWALYSIFTKPLIARYGGAFVTAVTLGLGTLVLLPLGLHYGLDPLRLLGPGEWFWLAFLALVSTALGYAMWNHAIRHRAASHVTSYIYLNPVVATVMGAWVLPFVASFAAIPVTPWFLAGSALVLVGLFVVHRARIRSHPGTGGILPAEMAGAKP